MFYLYIIKNKNDKYYIGTTKDLEDRLIRHNANRSKSTKSKGPWELVYTEYFQSRSGAMEREYYIKRQKSKNYINKLISKKP